MKFRSEVDTWLDSKAEDAMRRYFRQLGPGPFELDVFPSDEFISERLRRYMMGLVRLIYNYHVEELGQADLSIRDVLHEIEDTLQPEYEVLVYADGLPLSRWYAREALNIKDKLQTVYAPRGLYLPDPNTNYKEE